MFKYGLIIAASLSLTGCSTLLKSSNVAEEFDCPAQAGVGCKSIKDIRSMIVTGGAPQSAYYNTAGPEVSVSGVPKWSPDVILKMHVGSYIDTYGDYHEDSVVYVVARQGGWDMK